MDILEKADAVEPLGAEHIFQAENQWFASTEKALAAAEAWKKEKNQS